MSIRDWVHDDAQMIIDTPHGIPGELRSVHRTLKKLDILDDAMFLRVLADAIRIDPISLCVTIAQGNLNGVPGLRSDELSFVGTTMFIEIDDDDFDGAIGVGLIDNSLFVVSYEKEGNDKIDVNQWSADVLLAPDILNYLLDDNPEVRLSRLRALFADIASTACAAQEPFSLQALV